MPSTKNYTWSGYDCLGIGAQGEVFAGYDINTGEEVAIKVMKNRTPDKLDQHLQLLEKELEVLRKLDHPNIVKLIGEEYEDEKGKSQRKIIIMELCKGGCLHSLLQEPENKFGFDDAEFLNVLKGITAGMEELHKKEIVHRDIKPLNIMKYIGEDGRTSYKLIDFGGARELEDDKEFSTVVGTEEYLHPGLYYKAYFNKNSGETFNKSVDLWSMGATLYHVATGDVPFRSYGGRDDKNTMFKILAGKQSGDISGKQENSDSEIIYCEHLPDNCLMSKGLRPAVEELLAKLLEGDKDKSLSFEDFFEMANKIIRKKIVNVFDCGTTDVLKVYIDPTSNFQDFQNLLYKQTESLANNQLLLHENLDFAEQFGSDIQGLSCREVVDLNPVYLFHECHDIVHSSLDDIKYAIVSRSDDVFSPTGDDRDHSDKADLNFSRWCCQSLYYIRRNVIKSQLRQRLIDSGAVMLIRFLSRKYDKFVVKLEHLDRIVNNSLQMAELFEKMDQSKTTTAKLSVKSEMCEIMEKTKGLQTSSTKIEQGHQVAVNLWTCEKPSCKEEDCCTSRIEFLLTTAKDIRSEFRRNDKMDGKKRKLKCQKLESCCKSAKTLIEDHCQKNAYKLIDRFLQFLGKIWSKKEDLEQLERDLEDQFEKHALLIEKINEWKLTANPDLPKVTSINFSSMNSKSSNQGSASTEQKYVKQLMCNSIANVTPSDQKPEKVALMAKENEELIQELIERFSKVLPSMFNEAMTYQERPSETEEDDEETITPAS